MPHETTLSEILAHLLLFQVDVHDSMPITVDGKTIATVTGDDFLSHMYELSAQRYVEDGLIHDIDNCESLVMLAGFRGSGKSSAIHWVMRKLRNTREKVVIVYVNVKRLADHAKKKSGHEITIDGLLQSATDAAFQLLFPKPTHVKNMVIKLLASSQVHPNSALRQVLSDLHAVGSRAFLEANIPEDAATPEEDLASFFATHLDSLLRYHDRVTESLRLPHVIAAATATSGSRVVTFFDNVDRLSPEVQAQFLEATNDWRLDLGQLATTIVALRTENTVSTYKRNGSQGDTVRVRMPLPEDYPGWLLPGVDENRMRAVFARRQAYATTLLKLAVAEVEVALLNDTDAVHGQIVNEFVDASVHMLSNGSVRHMVSLYSSFITYLILLLTFKPKPLISMHDLAIATTLDDGRLKTLFFLFLREKGEANGIILYDVFKNETDRPHRKPGSRETFRELASEHHLLMTCVHNATSSAVTSGTKQVFPPVALVAQRMSELGFSFPEVRAAISDLCARPGDVPLFLEPCEAEASLGDLREDSSVRLRLTMLGKETITKICAKVGYAWGRSARPRAPQQHFLELDTQARVRVLYDDLARFAADHLRLLDALRAEYQKHYRDRWLAHYRERFAVDGRFQVERTILEAKNFFRHYFAGRTNAFESLETTYEHLLEKIGLSSIVSG